MSSIVSVRRRDRLFSTALATAWLLFLVWAAVTHLTPWPDILLRNDFTSFWTGLPS
ncbi:MAG: hypothetical protein ACYC66_00200 [Chloroflexota bacterium]